MAIEGIHEQIKSDDGVCGARVRKQAQRQKDAGPARVSTKAVAVAKEPELAAEELEDIEFFKGAL